jgi:hypothetical protein
LYGSKTTDVDNVDDAPFAKRPRTVKPKTVLHHEPLSPIQLAQLEAYCQSNDDHASWLTHFDTYLERVEWISAANKRNVLRQVRVLVAGDCIEYSHWPEGVSFNQARTKIHLGMDLVQLLSDADDFERENGRDLGNGAYVCMMRCSSGRSVGV